MLVTAGLRIITGHSNKQGKIMEMDGKLTIAVLSETTRFSRQSILARRERG